MVVSRKYPLFGQPGNSGPANSLLIIYSDGHFDDGNFWLLLIQ
jgi:hypothetical protein